ncbi:MAG: hypothetical protein A2045_17545 [Rhodocyclales bacterium GWA2_65_20]|nr:MAG: hypothetical protein A2045_17545 [Rhodocyclales bacterium GWA2_65_20]
MQQPLLVLAAQHLEPVRGIVFPGRAQYLWRQLHVRVGMEQVQFERRLQAHAMFNQRVAIGFFGIGHKAASRGATT